MHTPFFPAFRARLAPLGRRVQHLRQQSLCHLELLLGPFLPPGLLSQAEEGTNSRERVFSVRRTFFGFLYQVLKPDTSCREIVRQIQALFALHDQGPVDENTSAYCQARKRLPLDTALPRAGRGGRGGRKNGSALARPAAQGHRRHHRQRAGHSEKPARLSPIAQPEARLRLSADPLGGGVQPGHGRVARLRQGQQAPT